MITFQDLTFLGGMLSFLAAAFFYIYLLTYLQKEKPSLLQKISFRQDETLMILNSFPVWMKVYPLRFITYLVTKDEEDDKKSLILKLGYVISILTFIFLFIYNLIAT